MSSHDGCRRESMMKRTGMVGGWLAGLAMVCTGIAVVAAQSAKPAVKKGSNTPASLAFRSSVDTPPPGWKGPVFKLSRDYPKTPPKCDAPWLKRNVNFNASNPQ